MAQALFNALYLHFDPPPSLELTGSVTKLTIIVEITKNPKIFLGEQINLRFFCESQKKGLTLHLKNQ